MSVTAPVAGFLYSSEADSERNETVCQVVSRAEAEDFGCGIEPTFNVRFSDGLVREVLSQQLTPWYPV